MNIPDFSAKKIGAKIETQAGLPADRQVRIDEAMSRRGIHGSEFLPKEDVMPTGPGKPGQPSGKLAETPEEAQRMTYAGRSTVALRESRTFDESRVEGLPLFAPAKRQGGLFS